MGAWLESKAWLESEPMLTCGKEIPECYADELIMSLRELEEQLRYQRKGNRFCEILVAALEDLPREVLNKFEENKKPIRCFLSHFPMDEDPDPGRISVGTVESDEKLRHIRMIFDYASVNRLSDEAVRGLIGRLIAIAYLGRCTEEEADEQAISWGFGEGVNALGEELKTLEPEFNW